MIRFLVLAAAVVVGAAAQQPTDPREFAHLEAVLRAAMLRAAPSVVTIETFGGTRRQLGEDGAPLDAEAPPPPRPAPKPKPKPKPKETPKPEPAPAPAPAEPKPEGEPDPEAPEKDPKKKPQLGPTGFQQAQGKTAGIVLSHDGWILVSRFALNFDPTTILVSVPGRGTFTAQRAGEDTSRGIALVKIEASGLPVPDFVAPADVHVGQWAFVLGRTFAIDEPTVHCGIVSAKQRLFGRALQIDAYTSPANYGGAVVDVHGRVLGIAVPLSPSGRNAGVEWYDSGIGFAATIADIQPLLERMKRGEVLQRGWLGVQFAAAFLGPGARIANVVPDSAAAAAGLAAGDLIVAIDGTTVRNGPHAQVLLSSRLGGDPVTLRVQKPGAAEAVAIGPLQLRDAPWSEQKQGQDAGLPAAFPLPEKREGR